jgi:hypothetical protein
MRLSRKAKGGLACLALIGAIGAAALVSGGSASSVEDPELSPAEIVALRFPEEIEEAISSAPSESAADRELERQTLSILAFNPDPLGVHTAQAWRSAAPSAQPGETADQTAAAAAEQTGSVTAAPERRTTQNARAKRQPPKLFNDAQIASIKQRLRLSREQERYWPSVESALRYIGWRHARERTQVPSLDPDDVERVKVAAVPLIMSLREDQKHEVRMLAHVMGLEKIAAQF